MFEFEYDGIEVDDFRHHAKRLHENGLPPLAIGKETNKRPWHRGVTGRGGVDAELDEIESWPEDVVRRISDGASGVLNLGIRMPIEGSRIGIGIDVDDYVTANGQIKHGLHTIAEHSASLGPLPLTYRLSARPYESGSGIRLYRVDAPDGWEARGELKASDGAPGHVEFIQRHHRLAVVPPSIRPDLGEGVRVRLYDERTGEEVPDGIVPPLSEWAVLPDAWRDAIAKQARAGGERGEATTEEVEQFCADCTDDYWPHLLAPIVKRVRDERDSTRNTARDELCRAARHARIGCFPAQRARDEIEAAARESYAARGEPDRFDPAEFHRLEQFAIGQALADDIEELQRRAAIDLSWKPGGTAPEHVTPWENWMRIRRALDRNGGRIPMKRMDSGTSEETPAGGDRVTRSLADVEPAKVEWLWKPWVPLGKVSIIEGEPDVGKSVLTLTMAAIVSTGGTWPETTMFDGAVLPPVNGYPAGVVLVGIEDDEADTIVPRLIATGADRCRIHTMLQPTDNKGNPKPFVIPDDVDRLRRAIVEVGAKLVVIDPITAYLSTKQVKAGDDPSTRQALMPLVTLARETDCAIVLVRHLNKAAGMTAKNRGSGTIAYTGITRSVVVAGKLIEPVPDGATHAIALTKGNLTKDPMAFGYRLDSAESDPDSPVITWCGPISLSADQLVGADGAKVSDARKNAPARQEAKEILVQLLADGPINAGDAIKLTKQNADCGIKVVRAAAKELGVVKRQIRGDGAIDHWTWELPPKPVIRVPKTDGSS